MSVGVKYFTLLHISFPRFPNPFEVQRQMKWLGFSWQCVVKVFTEGGSIKDTNRQSYSVYDSYFAILLIVNKNQWIFDFALSVVKSDASCYCSDYLHKSIFLYIFLFQCWSVKPSWLCCFLLWQTPEPLCIRCKPINDIVCVSLHVNLAFIRLTVRAEVASTSRILLCVFVFVLTCLGFTAREHLFIQKTYIPT